jgi:hypothetical protein
MRENGQETQTNSTVENLIILSNTLLEIGEPQLAKGVQ